MIEPAEKRQPQRHKDSKGTKFITGFPPDHLVPYGMRFLTKLPGWVVPLLSDLLFAMIVVQVYGLLTGGLWSGYIFHLGDPALIGAMIKEHGKHWLALDFNFREQSFFYPYPGATFFTENFIGQGLIFAPFSGRSVVSISHLVYWSSCYLSLVAMIQILRQWTKNVWVAYLVAVLWAFNPQRALNYGHIQGNFQNTWDSPILFCIWSFTHWVRSNRIAWGIAALLLFWAQFFFSALYPTLCFLIGFVPLLLFSRTLRKVRYFAWLVVALAGYGLLLTPYRETAALFQASHTVEQVTLLSSSIRESLKLYYFSSAGYFLAKQFRAFFHMWSIYPGIVLTLIAISGLRFVKESSSVRWCWILGALFFIATLGPVIQWSHGVELFPNPAWMWALEKVKAAANIRAPQRFLLGMHWIFALLAALALDRMKFAPIVQNSRWKLVGLPLLLVVLFLTDLRVKVLKVPSDVLAEPVHTRIPAGAVIAEFPTLFRMPVRFRSLAVATERNYRTVDGQAAFLTPLAGWLQYLTLKGMTVATVEPLRLAGVTSIILHCHLFQSTDWPGYCEAAAPVLLKSGYFVSYRDKNDIVFQTKEKLPLKMAYQSLDPRMLEFEPLVAGAERILVAKPKEKFLVAFPNRCYPVQIQLKPSNEILTQCYTSYGFVPLPKRLRFPGTTRAVTIFPLSSESPQIRVRFPVKPKGRD